MAYEVVRSRASDRDLELIFDYFIVTYLELGDAVEEALTRAASRVRSIEHEMDGLARAPHQGTLCPEMMPGLRRVTKNRTIFYFRVDEHAKQLQVLAIFFGGQDHVRHMLRRILE